LLTEKQLQLQYQARGETQPKRLIAHPLGIILRGQINYLCATLFNYQDIVLLPTHRILDVQVLKADAIRLKGFSLHNYAHSGALGFVSHGEAQVCLRFNKQAGLHLYETPLSLNQTIVDEGETLLVTATVAMNKQFEWWVNGFGDGVTWVKSHVK